MNAVVAQAFSGTGAAELFLLGRLLFGGVLAFMGLNHFMDTESMVGYAEFKGVPYPRAAVLVSGGMLLFGGLGIVVGAYPVLSAGALATFLFVGAVQMHDFWTIEDPEEKQSEMTQFLKNIRGSGRLSRSSRSAGRRGPTRSTSGCSDAAWGFQVRRRPRTAGCITPLR